MWTDSESLMREGIAAAREAFADFLQEMDWSAVDIQKTFCHQVGRAHQRLLFEALGLDPQLDYSTFEYLGNTGAVALPMTAAIGIEQRLGPARRPRRPAGHRLGDQRGHAWSALGTAIRCRLCFSITRSVADSRAGRLPFGKCPDDVPHGR